MAEPPKSRLDRELDEILAKKSKEPIAFRTHPRVQQHRAKTPNWKNQGSQVWHRLVSIPLALAFALVFAAMLVHGVSPLLALILNTGAVAAIWVPGIGGLTRGATPANPNVKYWRGRPYASEIKASISRSPMDSLKRFFDRRR